MKEREESKFDFTPIGKAIKENRLSRGMTQESVAEIIGCEQPYYATIENSGQCPSLQLLHNIVQLLHISLDEFFLPWRKTDKSSKRNAIDDLLDQLTENDLIIIEGTIKGIIRSKNPE